MSRLRSPLRVCGSLLRTLRDDGLDEAVLYHQGFRFGFDGSFIEEGDCVYILGEGVNVIDSFTGFHWMYQEPIAMMLDGEYYGASQMCHTSFGRVAFSVRTIQRQWRIVRSQRYEPLMLAFGS